MSLFDNGLPESGDKVPFPPAEWATMRDSQAEWSVWYGGNMADLATFYSERATEQPGSRFWARAAQNARAVIVHVPIVADIAQINAHLLFGEEVKVRLPSVPADSPQQARLDMLLEVNRAAALFGEAAEVASGLGGVFLKVDYDMALADYPILTIVQPDTALPEFRWGRLVRVTFWRVVAAGEKEVWRHLEYHDASSVQHGLYRGTPDDLGMRIALESHPTTRGLQEYTVTDDLNVVYIPNMLPNRRHRGEAWGQADCADCVPLLEALDEAYTSWVRDIRLAAARIVVPEEYVDVNLSGTNKTTFDLEREIFMPVAMDPTQERDRLLVVQPDIRHDAHYQTCLDLMVRILSAAGLAPQTMGLGRDVLASAASGVALKIKERKTLMMKARKERYWGQALEYLLYRMLVLDAQVFDSGMLPLKPTLEFGDSYAPDLAEVATAVELLHRGDAASRRVRLELVHPDWEEEQYAAEEARMDGDKQAAQQAFVRGLNDTATA